MSQQERMIGNGLVTGAVVFVVGLPIFSVLFKNLLANCDPQPALYVWSMLGIAMALVGALIFIRFRFGKAFDEIRTYWGLGFALSGIATLALALMWIIPLYGHIVLIPVCY